MNRSTGLIDEGTFWDEYLIWDLSPSATNLSALCNTQKINCPRVKFNMICVYSLDSSILTNLVSGFKIHPFDISQSTCLSQSKAVATSSKMVGFFLQKNQPILKKFQCVTILDNSKVVPDGAKKYYWLAVIEFSRLPLSGRNMGNRSDRLWHACTTVVTHNGNFFTSFLK